MLNGGKRNNQNYESSLDLNTGSLQAQMRLGGGFYGALMVFGIVMCLIVFFALFLSFSPGQMCLLCSFMLVVLCLVCALWIYERKICFASKNEMGENARFVERHQTNFTHSDLCMPQKEPISSNMMENTDQRKTLTGDVE